MSAVEGKADIPTGLLEVAFDPSDMAAGLHVRAGRWYNFKLIK
jgi:hypothetical protein